MESLSKTGVAVAGSPTVIAGAAAKLILLVTILTHSGFVGINVVAGATKINHSPAPVPIQGMGGNEAAATATANFLGQYDFSLSYQECAQYSSDFTTLNNSGTDYITPHLLNCSLFTRLQFTLPALLLDKNESASAAASAAAGTARILFPKLNFIAPAEYRYFDYTNTEYKDPADPPTPQVFNISFGKTQTKAFLDTNIVFELGPPIISWELETASSLQIPWEYLLRIRRRKNYTNVIVTGGSGGSGAGATAARGFLNNYQMRFHTGPVVPLDPFLTKRNELLAELTSDFKVGWTNATSSTTTGNGSLPAGPAYFIDSVLDENSLFDQYVHGGCRNNLGLRQEYNSGSGGGGATVTVCSKDRDTIFGMQENNAYHSSSSYSPGGGKWSTSWAGDIPSRIVCENPSDPTDVSLVIDVLTDRNRPACSVRRISSVATIRQSGRLRFGTRDYPSSGSGGGADSDGGSQFDEIFIDVPNIFSAEPVYIYQNLNGTWGLTIPSSIPVLVELQPGTIYADPPVTDDDPPQAYSAAAQAKRGIRLAVTHTRATPLPQMIDAAFPGVSGGSIITCPIHDSEKWQEYLNNINSIGGEECKIREFLTSIGLFAGETPTPFDGGNMEGIKWGTNGGGGGGSGPPTAPTSFWIFLPESASDLLLETHTANVASPFLQPAGLGATPFSITSSIEHFISAGGLGKVFKDGEGTDGLPKPPPFPDAPIGAALDLCSDLNVVFNEQDAIDCVNENRCSDEKGFIFIADLHTALSVLMPPTSGVCGLVDHMLLSDLTEYKGYQQAVENILPVVGGGPGADQYYTISPFIFSSTNGSSSNSSNSINAVAVEWPQVSPEYAGQVNETLPRNLKPDLISYQNYTFDLLQGIHFFHRRLGFVPFGQPRSPPPSSSSSSSSAFSNYSDYSGLSWFAPLSGAGSGSSPDRLYHVVWATDPFITSDEMALFGLCDPGEGGGSNSSSGGNNNVTTTTRRICDYYESGNIHGAAEAVFLLDIGDAIYYYNGDTTALYFNSPPTCQLDPQISGTDFEGLDGLILSTVCAPLVRTGSGSVQQLNIIEFTVAYDCDDLVIFDNPQGGGGSNENGVGYLYGSVVNGQCTKTSISYTIQNLTEAGDSYYQQVNDSMAPEHNCVGYLYEGKVNPPFPFSNISSDAALEDEAVVVCEPPGDFLCTYYGYCRDTSGDGFWEKYGTWIIIVAAVVIIGGLACCIGSASVYNKNKAIEPKYKTE